MTAITELRAEAAKHPPGSHLAKLLGWAELHIGDQAIVIEELEADLATKNEDIKSLSTALSQITDVLDVAKRIAAAGKPCEPYSTCAHDLTSFINIMAAHGVAPYAKSHKAAERKTPAKKKAKVKS